MSIEAVVHWGLAEDVCVVVDEDDAILLAPITENKKTGYHHADEVHIPLTKQQARALAEQLLSAADRCDELERKLDEINGE